MTESEQEDFDLPGALPDFEDERDADEEVGAAWQTLKEYAFNRRTAIFAGVFIVAVIAFFYVILPLLPGLRDGLRAVQEDADRDWLAVAVLCKIASYVAYIWLFRNMFHETVPRITWRTSTEISIAGIAATRLLGAAGAGGIALTFWAVRRAGMARRAALSHVGAFLVILYVIFMGAILIDGLLLYTGLVPGRSPFGVTMFPATIAAILFLIFGLALAAPDNMERVVGRWAQGRGKLAQLAGMAVKVPALISEATKVAVHYLRVQPAGLLLAVAWWAFDVAVLWASFKAFGGTPELAVVVMGYFVGMIANMLPVPGGVGAVEGGMIGTFAAFGVPIGPAVAAVLAYRLFAFFLPTIPGIIAYTQLLKTVGGWRAEDATIQSKVLEQPTTA